MNNNSVNNGTNSVSTESFKSQLKRLSTKKMAKQTPKNSLELGKELVSSNKDASTTVQKIKGKFRPDEDGQEITTDAATTSTPAPQDVQIASLSSEITQVAEITQTVAMAPSVAAVDIVTASATASAPSFSLVGLGAGAGAAVALGSSQSGGQSTSPSQASSSSVQGSSAGNKPAGAAKIKLDGLIALGPIVDARGLQIEAQDKQGRSLAKTTNIKNDGTFSIDVPGDYTGTIILKVSNTLEGATHYIDEATLTPTSLGNKELYAVFNVAPGQPSLKINVNPLTSQVAVHLFGSATYKALTDAEISDANILIARKYGISTDDASAIATKVPQLLINADGTVNPNANIVGLVLAMHSVLEANPEMRAADALARLKEIPAYKASPKLIELIDNSAGSFHDNAPTGSVTITDSAGSALAANAAVAEGAVLTASSSIADADGIPASGAGALSYKWQASADGGLTWADIAGATSDTFTTTQAQVGQRVRAVASYTDNFGTAETVNSVATVINSAGVITNPADMPSLSPTAIGDAEAGTARAGMKGFAYAAGDVNGDGLDDWMTATEKTDLSDNQVNIYYGNTAGSFDTTADHKLPGVLPPPDIEWPYTVPFNQGRLRNTDLINPHKVGDFNGDGVEEIAFTSWQRPLQADADHLGFGIKIYSPTTSISSPIFTLYSVDYSDLFIDSHLNIEGGDINGDGLSDILALARYEASVYIKLGEKNIAGTEDVIRQPNTRTIKIFDSDIAEKSLIAFTGAAVIGDVNGDGYGDFAVAVGPSTGIAPNLDRTPSKTYIVYGSSGLANLDLKSLRTATPAGETAKGFVINADSNLPRVGQNLAFDGNKLIDFNGDGLNDVVLTGEAYVQDAGKPNTHVVDVVFGKTSSAPVNINAVSASLRIILPELIGLTRSSNNRITTSNAGDVNGDGLEDLLITASWRTSDVYAAGTVYRKSYVVYGKTDSASIDLTTSGDWGFNVVDDSKLVSALPANYFWVPIVEGNLALGGSVIAAGDLNGDGLSDLIIEDIEAGGGTEPGSSSATDPQIVFGGSAMQGSSSAQPSSQWKLNYLGTSGNDTITGTATSETFAGGVGDDVMVGNGGADVMFGGAGKDAFVLNANNVAQLAAGVDSSGRLASIRGGAGIDTLSLQGSTGITLDFTLIDDTRVQSVEVLNLASNNHLKISWKDIQHMASMNLFNANSGWSGFNSDGSESKFHQVVVEGTSSSSLNFLTEGGWVKKTESVTHSGANYAVYSNDAHATQLLVNTAITII
ncbi:MAG: FG-GAP repeat protein [Burkholderiales bacterium]|nr:FG-GAP repeat protein [Burkholderiales bacterium]